MKSIADFIGQCARAFLTGFAFVLVLMVLGAVGTYSYVVTSVHIQKSKEPKPIGYVVRWANHAPVTVKDYGCFLNGVSFSADGVEYRAIQNAEIIELKGAKK